MAAPKQIPYPHIVRNPDILSGEPTMMLTAKRSIGRFAPMQKRSLPTIDDEYDEANMQRALGQAI